MDFGGLDIPSHIDALRTEGELLADAAVRAGFDAGVPSCPDWTVRDLVAHVGRVHRWATRHVTYGQAVQNQPSVPFVAPGDDEMIAWFHDGHAALIRALSDADPGLDAYTFLPASSPLAFWARRQAHETAIHRADAELAAGSVATYDPEFAEDGLDELISGFMSTGDRPKREEKISVSVVTTDTDMPWIVEFGPFGPGSARGSGDAHTTVEGSASDLYLLLWNRRGEDGIDVTGDPAGLDFWRSQAKI